jgi:hypothetical protein
MLHWPVEHAACTPSQDEIEPHDLTDGLGYPTAVAHQALAEPLRPSAQCLDDAPSSSRPLVRCGRSRR